jgi:hypothetical protein
MPELIKALLFVNTDKLAPGAARFANGNWSEIATIMSIIDRMVRSIGWSSFVMGKYIELHKRAGKAFPLSDFGSQLNAALGAIGNAEEGWTGTILAAKLAAIVQRQADWNFRLRTEDAQALLKILDSLIDLGDRRSAALEQTCLNQFMCRSCAFGLGRSLNALKSFRFGLSNFAMNQVVGL